MDAVAVAVLSFTTLLHEAISKKAGREDRLYDLLSDASRRALADSRFRAELLLRGLVLSVLDAAQHPGAFHEAWLESALMLLSALCPEPEGAGAFKFLSFSRSHRFLGIL